MPHEELEHPELVGEYLRSLQAQIDDLSARNERLRARIKKLEADREKLRARLPRRRRPKPAERQPSPPADRSIAIPGVGTIPDLSFPDGEVARPDLKVAVILDEFSRAGFQHEFASTSVPAVGWESILEANPPDLLFVESAYSGHDGSWAGRIARFGTLSPELEQITGWCRARGIPTVFWNKEDPINHDWFVSTASLFEWVLTVDSNLVDRYKARLGHDKVGVLQFAAQPVIHHPPEEESVRTGRIAFAGSYYGAKHPARRTQLEYLLDAALDEGLHIFDRMDRPDDPRFAWPDKYREHIVGSLTYAQTVEAYRRYRVCLNVNTVTDSPTMCARRIYEVLACGGRVVSGPALALDRVPVSVARDHEEARALLREALDNGPSREGLAWIQAGNTVGDRVEQLIQTVLG